MKVQSGCFGIGFRRKGPQISHQKNLGNFFSLRSGEERRGACVATGGGCQLCGPGKQGKHRNSTAGWSPFKLNGGEKDQGSVPPKIPLEEFWVFRNFVQFFLPRSASVLFVFRSRVWECFFGAGLGGGKRRPQTLPCIFSEGNRWRLMEIGLGLDTVILGRGVASGVNFGSLRA